MVLQEGPEQHGGGSEGEEEAGVALWCVVVVKDKLGARSSVCSSRRITWTQVGITNRRVSPVIFLVV